MKAESDNNLNHLDVPPVAKKEPSAPPQPSEIDVCKMLDKGTARRTKTASASRLDKLRRNPLAIWQQEIVALGKAHLSIDDEADLLQRMHRRAVGMCRIVEDLSMAEHESEISLEAVQKVMEVAQESIHIAMWLTNGKNAAFLDF